MQERYLYDAYGEVQFLNNGWTNIGSSAYANEILFGGYRYDAETKLYHVRNRMYHPTLGRWMQQDPMGYVDGASTPMVIAPAGISRGCYAISCIHD